MFGLSRLKAGLTPRNWCFTVYGAWL